MSIENVKKVGFFLFTFESANKERSKETKFIILCENVNVNVNENVNENDNEI